MSLNSVMDHALSLKTDAGVLNALYQCSTEPLTADVIFEQTVSFVISSMGGEREGLTKDYVRSILLEQAGLPSLHPSLHVKQ